MPERFNFACFLSKPDMPSPASAISAASAAFPDHIGSPIEAMVLDVRSYRTETQRWPTGEILLHKYPGPTELLFAYNSSLRSNAGRVCISFRRTIGTATMIVSLEDMAISGQGGEIAEACSRLHSYGLALATDCIVAAGGEIGIDGAPETPTQVLAAMMAPSSLARWIAYDAARLPEGHLGFEVVCRGGRTCVLRRN
jgi:hypothetical protein